MMRNGSEGCIENRIGSHFVKVNMSDIYPDDTLYYCFKGGVELTVPVIISTDVMRSFVM